MKMPVIQDLNALIAAGGPTLSVGKSKEEFGDAQTPGLFLECRASEKSMPTWYLRLKNAQGTNTYKKLGNVKDLSLAQARKLVKQIRAEHVVTKQAAVVPLVTSAEMTLDELVKTQVFPHIRIHKRSFAKDESMYAMRIGPKFGHLALSALNRRDIQKWHNDLLGEGLSPASCNHHVVFFRRVLNLAVSWELLDRNVLRAIPLMPLDNMRDVYMTSQQTQKLVEVLSTDANRPVCSILLFLLNTGARKMEAVQAKWADIDLENRVWKIPAANSKNKRAKSMPLSDGSLQVVNQLDSKGNSIYLFPNPATGLPYSGFMRVWYRLRKKANLPENMRTHDLRACLAERLLGQGASLYLVQRLLSHQDSRTTLRYARLAPQALLDGANLASVSMPLVQARAV